MKKKSLLVLGGLVLLVILVVGAWLLMKPEDNGITKVSVDYEKYKGITTLDFYEGGFMGPNEYLLIRKKAGRIMMRYAFSDDGRRVSMDAEDFLEQEGEDIHLQEEELDSDDWDSFLKDLADCRLESWRSKYVNENIMDGTQWHISIGFADGDELNRSGSNKFPRDYEDVVSLIKTLITSVN